MKKRPYRTVKGWDGRVYRVYLSQDELEYRERVKLWASVLLGTPLMVVIMALAAGMI